MKKSIILLFSGTLALFADTWTSSDGKTIEADFVRLKDDSLMLIADGKEYSVPLSRLDAKSQGYARFMQQKTGELVTRSLALPIIPESSLLEVIGYDPKLAEGKFFLMEAQVKTISKSSSLGSSPLTTAVIELAGGTRMEIDMSGEGDGRTTKAKVEDGKVVLLKAKSYSDGKWRDFEADENIIENGQVAVFRANVKRGRINGTGVATMEEIIKAKVVKSVQPRELTEEQKASIERIKIRVEYLESQLSGGTGFIGSAAVEYTDAEKEGMRKELGSLKAELAKLTKDTETERPFRRDRPLPR